MTQPSIQTGDRMPHLRSELEAPSLLERLMTISRTSALEEMASGVAHELNQPLGAIVTFAQAGERVLGRPEASLTSAREIFQLITKEALAAAEGIRNMRRLFSRDNFARDTCHIADILRELAPVLALLAPRPDDELRVTVASDLPRVSVDSLRIQHVLFTLVQNAFEALLVDSAPQQRQVRIEVCGDRYGVEIAVIDSGCGISEQHRLQVFHPFFTTKGHGTGLGLASARAIIEAHGGTIGFTSQEHNGTRFWFRLPACD